MTLKHECDNDVKFTRTLNTPNKAFYTKYMTKCLM